AAAIEAVRARGDRVLVVTAKYGAVAELALTAAGLDADEVVGDLFAEGKASALVEHGAWAYVGDHPGDIRAARTAQVHAVAVATGPTSHEELQTAGPDVLLADLTELPPWLAATRP
ncbi:MAG: HAD hydrolase-like protein, partial [Candidatus Nanopelagicales bacterium]